MSEISLDYPDIHKYIWNIVIKPLTEASLMTLKFVKFEVPLPNTDDPDDYTDDASDYILRLLALILSDELDKNQNAIADIEKKTGLPVGKIVKQLWSKIESQDELWTNIE
jgi:hypothetical protein